MSEQLSKIPSPFPFAWMEDFSGRVEPTEEECAAAGEAFDMYVQALRDTYETTPGALDNPDPVIRVAYQLETGDAISVFLSDYAKTSIDGGDHPHVSLCHYDVMGNADLEYAYERTDGGVKRTLVNDYRLSFEDLVSPEERLIASVVGEELHDSYPPVEATDGLTRKAEIGEWQALLPQD